MRIRGFCIGLVSGLFAAVGAVSVAAPPPDAGPPGAPPGGGATEERFEFGQGAGRVAGCPHVPGFSAAPALSCPVPTGSTEAQAIAIDAGRYPAGTSLQLDTLLHMERSGVEVCIRVFDVTANAELAGTRACRVVGEPWSPASEWDQPPALQPTVQMRITTPAVPLPVGEHRFVLQTAQTPLAPNEWSWNAGFPFGSYLILRW